MCTPETESDTTQQPALKGQPIAVSVSGQATIATFHPSGAYERIPPDGWNPTNATDDELSYYGVSPRPTSSTALAQWRTEWNDIPILHAGLCDDTSGTRHASINGLNWAGLVVNGHNDYMQAFSNVGVPGTNSSCGANSIYSTWVGLGGYGGSHTLLQNGFDGGPDVPPSAGGDGAWWEGITNGVIGPTQWISPNFIQPGDSLNMATTFDLLGDHDGQAQFGWHDLTHPKLLVLYEPQINGQDAWYSWDPNTAEFVNEVVGYPVRFFTPENWSNANVQREAQSPVAPGSVPHFGIYANGIYGNKALGLNPDALTSASSWTTNWFACG
jgi:hypothetical protein